MEQNDQKFDRLVCCLQPTRYSQSNRDGRRVEDSTLLVDSLLFRLSTLDSCFQLPTLDSRLPTLDSRLRRWSFQLRAYLDSPPTDISTLQLFDSRLPTPDSVAADFNCNRIWILRLRICRLFNSPTLDSSCVRCMVMIEKSCFC